MVYIKNKKGHYRLVNSRFEELFGVSNKEIQGKSDHEIFPREFAEQFRANDLRVLTDLRPYQIE